MKKVGENSVVAGQCCLESEAHALLPGLVKVMWAMRVDRPSAWSPAFEGLTPLDLHILAFIEARPDVILKELRNYLDVPNSTLTGLIDRLEKKGLIERVISGRDRRSFGLKLTAKGADLRKEQQQVRLASASKMLGALDSDEERRAFVGMLNKIGDRLILGEAGKAQGKGGV
ncbi:MarR family winged helix-turn-helix transcriptional regulator [Methanocella arvoryzae]|uniref:MarR family winged helix-turn-helix transcriptional regulator n=1 Tax=Methanocella arvoryzae TaxID=1175445 RepID=UPI000326B63D|nr:MarR family winged helix-turn-helix transcriptional regulator [Methanocella arvoryzae]